MADQATERMLAATRRRLFVVTLCLVALLVVAIGATAAIAGLRALDSDVDRALQASARDAVARLDGELPAGSTSDGETRVEPGSADTFILYLDPAGRLVADPSHVATAGLPDPGGVAAATSEAGDLRTVRAGGESIRLITLPIVAVPRASPSAGERESNDGEGEGGRTAPTATPAATAPLSPRLIGYVQAGFVLTLHDQESTSLALTTAGVALVGLLGAALVTLVVTGRALVPIRRTFEGQLRFVADASHELRTPATLIHATAQVLEREGLVSEEGRPLVADIAAESDRLGRLVGDLLALASAGTAELAIAPERVDLAGLVASAVRRVEPRAAAHGIPLVVRTVPVTLVGDPDRLLQLILILLDNALDHSPEGAPVDVEVRAEGAGVEIVVTDRGPGIPPAMRERIFEPFVRLPGVPRARGRSTGLGLSIARRIATAHGGAAFVEDGPSGGARFVVRLPLHASTALRHGPLRRNRPADA